MNHRQLVRSQGLYQNLPESEAAIIFQTLGVEYKRRGYPDYTILKDGEIFGFIEVKPRSEKPLRADQERFRRFCDRLNIPFLKWCPDDGIEPIKRFLIRREL